MITAEILRICLEGTAGAAVQARFAARFSGQRKWRLFGAAFCLLGGVGVNLLDISGTAKVIIYTLLLFGCTWGFSGKRAREAAVCTAVSMAVMQGCYGIMGGLEGLAVGLILKMGVMLRGEWLCLLFGLLPAGAFAAAAEAIADKCTGACFSGNAKGHGGGLALACLLPTAAAAVYINSVICANADSENLYIMPCLFQLTILAAAAGILFLWDRLALYESYCARLRHIISGTAAVRHDLKNHLLTVSGLIAKGRFNEAAAYGGQLTKMSGELGLICNTGSAAADLLMETKLGGLSGVRIKCRVNIPEHAFEE
ncbi:MAG: hypothetical protein NC078_11200, partial [Ruminococcus sp.]|nr:hypothetical protein [Ruminococcus sp.]